VASCSQRAKIATRPAAEIQQREWRPTFDAFEQRVDVLAGDARS